MSELVLPDKADLVVSDKMLYHTTWICEKWSEEAVDFARRWLDKRGISHVPAAHGEGQRIIPITEGIPSALLRMIVGEAEVVEVIEGNMLLNEGLQRLEDLTMIATVLTNQTAANAWGNTNAFLGVGDSATAEAATQTELQAATNRFY